jgi:hypothetical protein
MPAPRDACSGGADHIWVLRVARGHDQVHCARCQRCLAVEVMLRAYVTLHGGEVRHG